MRPWIFPLYVFLCDYDYSIFHLFRWNTFQGQHTTLFVTVSFPILAVGDRRYYLRPAHTVGTLIWELSYEFQNVYTKKILWHIFLSFDRVALKVAQRQITTAAATPLYQFLNRMQFVKYINTSVKDPMRKFIILPDAEGAPDYFSVTWKGDII